MNKKLKIVIACISSVLILAGTFVLGFFTREWTLDKETRQIMNLIDKYKKYYYFEQENVVDIISNEILDKYSTYYSKEEYEIVKRSAKGYGEGIGLSFLKNSSVINSVLGNSPAELQGVKEGGEVISINVGKGMVTPEDKSVIPNMIASACNGTDITIKVKYGEEEKTYTLTKREYLRTYVKYISSSGTYSYQGEREVNRVKITEESLPFNEKTAYIKYSSFNGKDSGLKGSANQLENALELFKSENKETLIFDLRDNGGGYLDILKDVSSLIVPQEKGEKVLTQYTIDKHGKKVEYYSPKSDFYKFNIKTLIVMLNENSASASEALYGAIYDYSNKYSYNLKTVISSSKLNGETVYKSYGKGIMQTTYLNSDGSAVKLTTAKLYWPLSSTCIHDIGITNAISSEKIVNAKSDDALNVAINLI